MNRRSTARATSQEHAGLDCFDAGVELGENRAGQIIRQIADLAPGSGMAFLLYPPGK